jgi:hypothetical protein
MKNHPKKREKISDIFATFSPHTQRHEKETKQQQQEEQAHKKHKTRHNSGVMYDVVSFMAFMRVHNCAAGVLLIHLITANSKEQKHFLLLLL